MKTQFVVLAFGLVTLAACGAHSGGQSVENRSQFLRNGTDDTDQFLKKYVGKFQEPDFKESFVISADGKISRVSVRQVGGGKNSQVPYPTVCSYSENGKILVVENRSAKDRQQYIDFATHVIQVRYTDIILTDELEPSTSANPDCQTFLKEEKAYLAKYGESRHSYYSELLSDSSFRIQTAGGGDYEQGGERTESTLDEIYTMVRQ